ncbi:MAG: PilZ domain-containing protein [Desulfobacterales bacterium]|jgi:hypothetical protein
MDGISSIIQGLVLISIILALLFVIFWRLVSRYKKQALGDTDRYSMQNLQFEVQAQTAQAERVQLKRPALIEKAAGVMKVGIKELTTSGAFITCPHPFAVGESFAIKILLNQGKTHRFQAEVIWNNQNVIDEEIVIRGMKVRFLKLSEQERKMIQETIALRLKVKALP